MNLGTQLDPRQLAFTLVEHLVVITLIGTLSIVSLVAVRKFRSSDNAETWASNIFKCYVGNQLYLAEFGKFSLDKDWQSRVSAEEMVGCRSWYERVAPLIGLGADYEQTQKLFVGGTDQPGILKVSGRGRVMEYGGGIKCGFARNTPISLNKSLLSIGDTYRNLVSFSCTSSTYFLIDTAGESSDIGYTGWGISDSARL